MTEILNKIIDLMIQSFDVGLMLSINIITYTIIKFMDDINKEKHVPQLTKRLVFYIISIVCGGIYLLYDTPHLVVFVSVVFAHCFWLLVLKPICKHFNIDYNQMSKYLD